MPANLPYELRIAAAAFKDVADIWDWTVKQFGHGAALRYETLIYQAIGDIAEDSQHPGAKPCPNLLPGLWLYHLTSSRNHAAHDKSVKSLVTCHLPAPVLHGHRHRPHPARQPRLS